MAFLQKARLKHSGRFYIFLFAVPALLLPAHVFSQDFVDEDEYAPAFLSEYFEIEELSENTPEEPEFDIEEMRRRIYDEDPEEFISLSLRDSAVSLFMTGSWKGTLQSNFGFSHSDIGFGFASPETPFLFQQEADLTMSLWIRDRWFVEANFLDDSEQNTYRAGYSGLSGEFLQYAGIGNTGLDFPAFPYLDLGGDSPSSFGFYSRMENNNLNIHALLRYDSASREERVFTGSRERSYSYIQPQNSIRGISFVLPDTNIDSEITVYIEDEKGTLRDSSGRRWRQALSSEYAAGRVQGILDLNIRSDGWVAVSYSKNGTRPWLASMGSYDGRAGDFLFEVQRWFDASRINLKNYPQSGGGSGRPGEATIGSVTALVIRQPGTFSPFEKQNRYDAPSSTSEYAELIRLSSGTEINGFELVSIESSSVSSDIPLYISAVSQRSIYELLPVGSGLSSRDPEICWPLAEDYPEIYLPGAPVFSGDITLRFTNYSSTGGYFIGTDVVDNSIQIWRSGIQDSNFSYNSSSGEVTLYTAVSQNEVIRITYLRRNEETRLGSIAAGLGAVYESASSPFSAQAALGIRWNLSESSAFTEEDISSVGTVGLSGKVAWDYDSLKARVTAGFAFEQTDTTGLYRAAGMEGNEIILPLTPENAFLSHPPSSIAGLDLSSRTDLIFRNYYSNTVLGSTLMPVTWNGSEVIANIDRPYPVRDQQLGDTQALVMEFNMKTNNWTGFESPVGYDSEILSGAVEIEIPYRFYGFSGNGDGLRLIVQIGALSEKDFVFTENPDLILEKLLFLGEWKNNPPSSANDFYSSINFDQEARIARFVLDERDRLKLGDAKYLRVIAVNDGMEEISGRIIIAPPIVRAASFRPVTFDGSNIRGVPDFSTSNNVIAWETIEIGANTLESVYGDIIKRLHPSDGTQRVLKIEWNNMEPGISAGVDGRMGELPLANYRELSFFVKGPEFTSQQGTLNFIAAPGPDSLYGSFLEARIPMSALRAGQWSKVTIRYQGSGTGVMIDGGSVEDSYFHYRPTQTQADKPSGRAGYAAILVDPQGYSLPAGSICIDEIILEDSLLVYRMNLGGAFEYAKRGVLLSAGRVPVLSDLLVSSTIESEIRTNGNQDLGVTASVANITGAEISVLGANVSGNLFSTAAKESFSWSAEQNISRSFGPLSVAEGFFAAPSDKTAQRNLKMALLSDFYSRFDADSLYEFSRLRQKWNFDTGYRSQRDFIPSLAVKTEAMWTGKNSLSENESYANLWFMTWDTLFPDSGSGVDSRRTLINMALTERTRPVGVVITLEGGTNSTGVNNVTRLENSMFLDIPVVLSRSTLDLRAGRGFIRQLDFYGDDVFDDTRKFFESVNDSIPVWKIFPGYSLFSPKLAERMDEALDNSQSADIAQYTAVKDQLSTNINFPPVYNLASFFIPSSASLRLERVLEQKLDTRTDILNFSSGLGFTAFNMFGAWGHLPLFKFYRSDEFSYGIESAVIFNEEDDIPWRIRAVFGAGFWGFSGGVLNFANALTYRSGGYWLESLNSTWTVPTKNSLIGLFYNWVVAKAASQNAWLNVSSLLNTDYEQLRKESLELTVDKTGDYMRWNVTAGHEAIIRILGRLEFTTFVKLRYSEDKYSEVIIFDALIGTTLKVSF